MNKRDAKRMACNDAAQILRTSIDSGYALDDERLSEEDHAKLTAAMTELVHEMERRGEREPAE